MHSRFTYVVWWGRNGIRGTRSNPLPLFHGAWAEYCRVSRIRKFCWRVCGAETFSVRAYPTRDVAFTGAGRNKPWMMYLVKFSVALWHLFLPTYDITDVILLLGNI